MTQRRLIEEAFPLKNVSEHSKHDKNVRHGHISTLHIWPARRPLSACRAASEVGPILKTTDRHDQGENLPAAGRLWTELRAPRHIVLRPHFLAKLCNGGRLIGLRYLSNS